MSKAITADPSQPVALTLADVLQRLATLNLSPARRRDLASALNRAAELFDDVLHRIPADPAVVREKFAAVAQARGKISEKTLQNLRSNVAAAIALTKAAPLIRTAKILLGEGWANLHRVSPRERTRNALSRFGRFCSVKAIEPVQVDDDVFAAFAAALQTQMLVRKPDQVHREAACEWNREHPELGLKPLTPPPSRFVRKRVAWADVVPSLRAEVDAYCAWLAGGDMFAEDARPRFLKPTSVRGRREELLSAVSALVDAGRPLSTIATLADLVDRGAYRAILLTRLKGAGEQANAYNNQVAKGLVVVAREWVKLPQVEIDALKADRSRMPALPTGLTAKNTALLRQFEDVELRGRLLHLAEAAFEKASRMAPSERSLARAQAALALSILLDVAMRLRNLTDLEFDRTLHLSANEKLAASIEIPAHETKGRVPISAGLSLLTTGLLRAYRNRVAPAVLGAKPRWVFVNEDGSQKGSPTVEGLFTRLVKAALGIHMTPHQVRHLVAKLMLDDQPGAYESVRQLLGHSSSKTTVNFYAGLNTRRAATSHQKLLAALRDTTPPPKRPTRKNKKKN